MTSNPDSSRDRVAVLTTATYMTDCLRLLLDDIAKREAIVGKSQYLPLTRRIRRGLLLRKMRGSNDQHTMRKITDSLASGLWINQQHPHPLDLTALGQEVERYLDDADISIPNTLGSWFEQEEVDNGFVPEEVQAAAWECFDLLALLPVHIRGAPFSTDGYDVPEFHFQSIEQQYESSRQRLVEGMLRFVLRICSHYTDRGVHFLDLFQEGCIGLMRATEMYDERVGARFETYSATWIRQYITRYVADTTNIVRIPVHAFEAARQVAEQYETLADILGREPSDDEFIVNSGMLSYQDIRLLRQENKRRNAINKFNSLNHYVQYLDTPIDEIDEQLRPFVQNLHEVNLAYKKKHGYYPKPIELLHAAGLISTKEVMHIQSDLSRESKQVIGDVSAQYQTSKKVLWRYRMTNAEHHSPHDLSYFDERTEMTWYLADILSSEESTESQALRQVVADRVAETLSRLSSREQEVIRARLGLDGQEEETLEEVGQRLGVTRERVRQIEAKALRRLRHPVVSSQLRHLADHVQENHMSIWDLHRLRIYRMLESTSISDNAFAAFNWATNQARVRNLLLRYIGSGRRRTWNVRAKTGRAEMFRQILRDANQPLHYRVIHDLAMKEVPPELQVSYQRSYATLFYHPYFQAEGKGLFGLVDWSGPGEGNSGFSRLRTCPKPFVKEGESDRSFFESIMVGKELFAQRPQITGQQFYMEMLAWAGREMEDLQGVQDAFDAWYSVGLVSPFNYLENPESLLKLAAPTDIGVNDMRIYCVMSLCERVPKTSELLLTLDRIPHTTTDNIQKTLFGMTQIGTEVVDRLRLLKAFDAVRLVDDEWQLSAAGKIVLTKIQPAELPDIGELLEAETAEEQSEVIDIDDDLALLLI